MKLNPDCVRDILLTVEEHSDYHHVTEYKSEIHSFPRFRKYTYEEILYHIRQCEYSSLILGVHYYDGGKHVDIEDLSPDGHNFLANVRQDTIWNNTKSIAAKIGTKSLDALVQISSNVITELIKAQFGLI